MSNILKKCILNIHWFILLVKKEDQNTVKPVLSSHSKRSRKLFFKTDYLLMQVKSIAECSKGIFFYFSIFEWSLKTDFTVTPDSNIFGDKAKMTSRQLSKLYGKLHQSKEGLNL